MYGAVGRRGVTPRGLQLPSRPASPSAQPVGIRFSIDLEISVMKAVFAFVMACPRKSSILAALTLAAASMAAPGQADAAPIYVPFVADQQASVRFPVVGLAENDNHYLLTNPGSTSTMNKDLTGETDAFANFDTTRDAASYDNSSVLQLSTAGALIRADSSTGAPLQGIGAMGGGAFGVGYDAATNTIGVGLYASGMMSFRILDGTTGSQIGSDTTFAFYVATHGIPTGLDFVVHNHSPRMLVGTRDQKDNFFAPEKNFILDMDATTGEIGQYSTTPGASNKLQDLLYSDGKLVLGHQRSGTGFMQVGNYTPFSSSEPFSGIPGDANLDGVVDDLDLSILQSYLGALISSPLPSHGVPAGWVEGDFSGDGRVTLYDAYLLFQNYSSPNRPAVVPEPGALLVFVLAAGVVLCRKGGQGVIPRR